MHVNRSRDSILQLFDPLVRPETPPRNTGSPDSSSDKENDNPIPGPVTEFFNRFYKTPDYVQLPPGKLIDFGDASMSSDTLGGNLGCAEVEATQDSEMEGTSSNIAPPDRGDVSDLIALTPAKQRAPLAEIKLESTPPSTMCLPPTIDEDSEMSDHSDPALLSEEVPVVEEALAASTLTVSAAPYGTPLADVINSIILPGFVPVASFATGEDAKDTFANTACDSSCPSINICPPDEEVMDDDDQRPESSYHLSPTSFSQSSSGIRRQPVSTSANDPRRVSVDLYSSFSLHMQSADLSFDLLNDKISLFGQPQDPSHSLWPGLPEDDILDFARERRAVQDGTDDNFLKTDLPNIDEDTFDLTKAKISIDAVAEAYGSIHEESLHVAEAVAAAAVVSEFDVYR